MKYFIRFSPSKQRLEDISWFIKIYEGSSEKTIRRIVEYLALIRI